MKNTFTYNIPVICSEYERLDFESSFGLLDIDWIAEDAAKDYHHNRDGWEHQDWPIELLLYSEDGLNLLGKFSVDREAEPVFCARKMKQ
jgi:hypothetical protein